MGDRDICGPPLKISALERYAQLEASFNTEASAASPTYQKFVQELISDPAIKPYVTNALAEQFLLDVVNRRAEILDACRLDMT